VAAANRKLRLHTPEIRGVGREKSRKVTVRIADLRDEIKSE